MKQNTKWILAGAVVMLIFASIIIATQKKGQETPIPPHTPSISLEQLQKEVDFALAEKQGEIVTADSGEVVIPSGKTAIGETYTPTVRTTTPDTVWELPHEDDFTLPEAVLLSDGSLGRLRIPTIGLDVSIYETEDEIEDMVHGVAHMKETSCWKGNVGLAGHNRGVNTYFGKLHTLKTGDTIHLTTALGSREYKVAISTVIEENNWSFLGRTDDNRLTLITCIDNQPSKRLCVQAVEE